MRSLLLFCLLLSLVLGACTPGMPDPTATPTHVPAATSAPAQTALPTPAATPTGTPTPLPTPAPTRTATPTPTAVLSGGEGPEPPGDGGYAFEFSRNYSGDATIVGKAHTCGGLRGPWSLEVAVSGSPEPGATFETTGAVVFGLPPDQNSVEVRIPTTGTGTFDYGDGVGEGTIDDPLLFIFRLMPDRESAEVTVVSTGDGTVVLHLPDAPDVTILFGTVWATDPTFEVELARYDGCP
jgi:hypothetical protein